MEQEKNFGGSLEEVICEIWKPIKGYEGIYEISNLGRIKSLKRNNNRCLIDKIMKQYIGKQGYLQVRLCKNGKSKLHKVHILIANAFIDNPNNLPIINHIDGNKTNNTISNLEWCSYSHNIKHAYDIGLRKKKPIIQKDLNNVTVKKWNCIAEASEKTGILHSSIWKCCNKKNHTAGGYKWKYIE